MSNGAKEHITKMVSSSIELQSQLQKAELDAEKTTSVIRLVVFLTLAVVIFLAADERGSAAGAAIAVFLYGAGTAVGLFFAWRQFHHPVIPYLFVTFDVILVALQVLALADLMGMPAANIFALPATALIFIIMIHASMRYHPWLVVYAAALFIVAIESGLFVQGAAPSLHAADHRNGMLGTPHVGMSGLLVFQVLPSVLIVLAAFILFVKGRRTRKLLLSSIEHATRTARLSRYFSPNLAGKLADDNVTQTLAGRRQNVVVLFIDIRGFTGLGESMTPEELGAFLSEYRNRLAEPVFALGGMIDKFIGDAIMVVFGCPTLNADDAERAMKCALEILNVAEEWSHERTLMGRSPVAIGIGGHYGEVFAGALGSERLLEYTVIGDTVNIAERLERLSREVGSTFVVSNALLEAAGISAESANWIALPPQHLKGHKQPVDAVYLSSGKSNSSS